MFTSAPKAASSNSSRAWGVATMILAVANSATCASDSFESMAATMGLRAVSDTAPTVRSVFISVHFPTNCVLRASEGTRIKVLAILAARISASMVSVLPVPVGMTTVAVEEGSTTKCPSVA
ncbi:hypothetical protein D3C71_1706000 [compost metagenome]